MTEHSAGLADSLDQMQAALGKVRLSLQNIPTKDLAKLHDDSAEGRRPLPRDVMDAACALLRERIQYCGCSLDEEPSDHVAALAVTAERLEAAYANAYGRLASEIAHTRTLVQPYPYTPEDFRDASGRFILLDALTAIVHAQAVLAQIGAP